MTHTQVCDNAMNRECFCDCKGSLHGRNPKRGVFEMKEGYQSNPNDNKEEWTEKDEAEYQEARRKGIPLTTRRDFERAAKSSPEFERVEREKIARAWNKADYSTRLFTLGPVTGIIKDRDEAVFASHSGWSELSQETRSDLLKHKDLTKHALKVK